MTPTSPHGYDPVSPADMFDSSRRSHGTPSTQHSQTKQTNATTRSIRTNSTASTTPSMSGPRRARFAEATTVDSPATDEKEHRLPFSRKPKADKAPKPSDVGFGYISDNNPVEQHATLRPNGDVPLKSAMKTPGTAGRLLNPLSPTFREEQFLEKEEEKTEKQQAKDLKVKTRVRLAKMVLRGVNFSCSLIVLSMLSTAFSIFNATKHLPPRNNLPVWATGTKAWPQITVLVVSCVSLAFSTVVIALYWRGGHRRAQKTAVYYTMFAVSYFVFSTIMWLVAAGVLHGSKANGNGQDMWGWSCKDNERSQLFQSEVHYALVCRLQNWGLVCCIIEVVVEVISISIYAVVFYRFYSKNRLRKSMDARDRARSDLYLAQLRSQSAPNTPGFASMTPRSPHFPTISKIDPYATATVVENGQAPIQYAESSPQSAVDGGAFKLQAPPIRIHHATPKQPQDGFEHAQAAPPMPIERTNEHVEAAPGEQTYDAVPIPGAYASPLASPAYPPAGQYQSMGGQ